MMTPFQKKFKEYLSIRDPSSFDFNSWCELKDSLCDFESFKCFTRDFDHDPSSFTISKYDFDIKINFLIQQYSWDIYDKIFDVAISTQLNDEVLHDIMELISLMADILRPKEFHMMIVEKFAITYYDINEDSILQILLFSMQRVMILLSDDTSYLVSGLSQVLKLITSLVKLHSRGESNVNKTLEDATDDSESPINNEEKSSYLHCAKDIIIVKYIQLAVVFYDGIFLRNSYWCTQPDLIQSNCILTIDENQSITPSPSGDINTSQSSLMRTRNRYPFAGFLLGLSSQCLILSKSPQTRVSLMHQISQRILLSGIPLDDILVHPLRARYRILRAKLKKIHNSTHNKSKASTMPSLIDSIPLESRSEVITYVRTQSCTTSTVRWADVLPWTEVTDQAVRESSRTFLEHSSKNIPGTCLERTSKNIHVTFPDPDSIYFQEERDFFCPDLPLTLTGVSMFAHTLLCSQSSNSLLPAVYCNAYLWESFSVFLLPLLQHCDLAQHEGREMILALDKLLKSDRVQPLGNNFFVYLPQLAHVTADISVQSLVHCTGTCTGLYSQGDINIIGAVAAKSADSLALMHSLLFTASACPDPSIRNNSITAWKSLLKLFDHKSRLLLLNKLTENCPIPAVAGLLVDCVREQCQMASSQSSKPVISAPTFLRGQDTGLPHEHMHVPVVKKSDTDLLQWGQHSVFWSPYIFHYFIEESIQKISTMSTSEIIQTLDQINACTSLLQFIVLKFKMIFSTSSESSSNMRTHVHVLYIPLTAEDQFKFHILVKFFGFESSTVHVTALYAEALRFLEPIGCLVRKAIEGLKIQAEKSEAKYLQRLQRDNKSGSTRSSSRESRPENVSLNLLLSNLCYLQSNLDEVISWIRNNSVQI